MGYNVRTMSNISPAVDSLVRDFANSLAAAIEADVARRLQGVLAAALGTPAASVAAARRSVGRPARVVRPARRQIKVTPELAKARKLQGQYLGALRGLKAADHARVKSTAHEKGLPAAIKLAHSIKR
jgi:hypothetical protein